MWEARVHRSDTLKPTGPGHRAGSLRASRGILRRGAVTALMALGALGLAACGEGDDPVASARPNQTEARICDLNSNFLMRGAAQDGIPSLDDPVFVSADVEVPGYLDPDTRVIGLVVGEDAYAIPHNVLWFHEIVNLTVGSRDLAVTYCPLTGSSLAFDRLSIGGATFGVSGLLYKSNLIMYDRNEPSSRWPQMLGEAACGPSTGTPLRRWPVVEMRWAGWLELHPSTRVLSGDQGFPVTYEASTYPYGDYEHLSVESFFGPMPAPDRRRPAKERVLGVPATFDEGGDRVRDPARAFPFGALEAQPGEWAVVSFRYDRGDAVVVWSDEARGGMAFRPWVRPTEPLALMVTEDGIIDSETGSRWSVEGRAVAGPMQGEQLESLEGAYVAFWGAWAAFHPGTELWEG